VGRREREFVTMTVTPEQISAAVNQGIYWFVTPDCTVYGRSEQTPQSADDIYLLRASQAWLGQWGGDWQSAADQINQAITKQEET